MLGQPMFIAHHVAGGQVGFRKEAHDVHVGQGMEQLVACHMTLLPQAGHDDICIAGVPHAFRRCR